MSHSHSHHRRHGHEPPPQEPKKFPVWWILAILVAYFIGHANGEKDAPKPLPEVVTVSQPYAQPDQVQALAYDAAASVDSSDYSYAGNTSSDAAPEQTAIAALTNTPAPVAAPEYSNNDYYTNSDGNTVHSPAVVQSGCAASGASAQCRDGTCSFSQHRSGTCSRHGGVAEWM